MYEALRYLDILCRFIQCDKTQIDDDFRKDDNRVTVTDQSSESVNIEMIEMSTNIDNSEQSSKKAESINEKTIKVLQTRNNKLRLHDKGTIN